MKFLPKRSFEFCNRLVSTVHATSAVALASLSVEDWTCPVCPLASKPSPNQVINAVLLLSKYGLLRPFLLQILSRFMNIFHVLVDVMKLKNTWQMQTLTISISYLIYDLICCHFDKRVTTDNTTHHLVSIVGIGAGLAYGKCGSELIAALFITEISSPFLHLRELLKELGYRDTDFNLAADISFAVVFSFAKTVFGPYITWLTLIVNNPLIIKAMAMELQLVSTYWFYKIARMVYHKLSKRAVSNNLVYAEKLN